MKTLTLFLTTLLVLVTTLLPVATAHRDKAARLRELERDYQAHTWQALVVNRMVFGYTLDDFMKMWYRRVGDQGVTDLVWSTDACTKVDDNPLGWNFKPACIRHDFGYRNFKRQGRLGHEARKKIDQNFKQDMFNICDRYSLRKACRVAARIYYAGVRLWGKSQKHRNFVSIAALSANTTDTGVATPIDTEGDTAGGERSVDRVESGYWFADWLAHVYAHPELLMEMTERDLDNLATAIDAELEDIERERDEEVDV